MTTTMMQTTDTQLSSVQASLVDAIKSCEARPLSASTSASSSSNYLGGKSSTNNSSSNSTDDTQIARIQEEEGDSRSPVRANEKHGAEQPQCNGQVSARVDAESGKSAPVEHAEEIASRPAASAAGDGRGRSRLKSFLAFTTHLNPFHQSHQSLNVSGGAKSSQRRSSHEEQTSTSGTYLTNLIQRYFGRHCSSGKLDSEQQQESKSAPVTPIKWRPLEQQQQHANGFASAVQPPPSNEPQSVVGGGKPSVRFVETASGRKSVAGDKRRTQFAECGVQTSSAGDATSAEAPSDECGGLDLVSRLFKLDAGGSDKLAPGECPMDSGKFRKYGYSLIDYISNYLDTIDKRRVSPLNIEPGYLKSLIQASAPEQGESFASIMHDFESHIMAGITHWQHPHFHAYFPAGNAYASILADMLSGALGGNGFSWAASPAYTELEIIMLDWLGQMIGLPDEFLCLSSQKQESKGGGVIQGSASECVLVNLLAARHWAIDKLRNKYPGQPDGVLLSKLIGYCSREAHSCVEKAAMIGFIRMRALETDERHALRGDTLERAMAADKAQGLEPFIVCATLGTTSCCSFDRLDELGQVCQREDVWLHVDAAYAGSALICPEFRHLMKGIELASSFNTNPNKWLLINFDCSLMWVKDRFKLTRAFVVDPLYLQHSFSDQAIDYRHWGIPLSRRFRALKLWFVVRNYGVDGLRAYIRNHVRLAKLFEQLIRADARFAITNEVVLGLVCFRLVGSNALNQRLLSMINASGTLHMVPASLNGRYVIRFCVCDQNAQEADIRYAHEQIAKFATELFESIRAGKERIRTISQQNTVDVTSISLHHQQSASADSTAATGSGPQQLEHSAAAAQEPTQLEPQSTCSGAAPVAPVSARSSPAAMGSKSPLVKQVSVQPQQSVAGEHLKQQQQQQLDEDLEQEIVLDSLATIDGYDDELDDDDLLEAPNANSDDQDPLAAADPLATAASPAAVGEGGATGSGANHTPLEQTQGGRARRWRAPHSRASGAVAATTEHEDEAEDEVYTLAERRQRMSLRYKREFFVRVVSDPRVYRASISGDINAHASCCSLGGSGAPSQAAAAAAETPAPPLPAASAPAPEAAATHE